MGCHPSNKLRRVRDGALDSALGRSFTTRQFSLSLSHAEVTDRQTGTARVETQGTTRQNDAHPHLSSCSSLTAANPKPNEKRIWPRPLCTPSCSCTHRAES